MKKKQVIDRSDIALSRCPIFLWMSPPPASYQPARIPDETPAATQRNDIRQRFYCFEFGISLELGYWDLELFPRSCKSLILLMIANNCRKLLGEKNIFMPQSKIRPGAASKELQTRADFGISLELLSAIAAAATADGTWDLERFHPHSCQIVPDGGAYGTRNSQPEWNLEFPPQLSTPQLSTFPGIRTHSIPCGGYTQRVVDWPASVHYRSHKSPGSAGLLRPSCPAPVQT